jgi:hypothetical protein
MSEKESAEHDLFDRLGDKVNKDPIREVLVEYRDKYPGEIQVSGNKADLVGHLRAAVTSGRIPRRRAFELLQEGEENGNQIIHYFKPTNDAVLRKCRSPQQVAEQLFGKNWQTTKGFPRLTKLKGGWDIVDFRTPYQEKPNDWLLKVYTFQEVQVRVREFDRIETAMKGVLGLRENEYAVIFERRVDESVCIARWNDDEEHPLLELRIELSGRLARFDVDINALWSRLKPAIEQEYDFEPWSLRGPLEQMLRQCRENTEVYELGLANMIDSGDWGVRYMPYTEHERIDTIPSRLDAIHQILDDGGWCERLVMTWLTEGSNEILDGNLRTYAGSRGVNELVIRASATAQAVDYVTDKLRSFAG